MSRLLTYVAIGVLLFVFLKKNKTPKNDDFNIEQVIEQFGYPVEKHTVTTNDDYILTLHRIPYGSTKPNRTQTPVLLMHGFMQSGIDFANISPEKSLSYILADLGYDVWLGHARGTTWSRKHKHLNPDTDKQFWNYDIHEIGVFDTKAFIDYVLKTTAKKSLHYVGFSQGTTAFFILAAEQPKYAKKITLMTALAPAIFLKNPKSPFSQFLLYKTLTFFNKHEIFARDSFEVKYLQFICNEKSIFVNLCLLQMFMIQGFSPNEVNRTMLAPIFTNSPTGVSPKQTNYILQLMETGNFERYDFGTNENLEIYGQANPPQYDLSKVSTPVALYYSHNDWTVNIENMDRITKELPNVVKTYKVPSESFNHNDFLQAKNVVPLLYNAVIEEMLKY